MPLLRERPTYKPFEYDWAYQAWLMQQKVHWLPEEVPLADDVRDWHRVLTDPERNLLTQIFRFFTTADIEVNNCYLKHYSQVFKPTEVLMMLSAFSNIECFDRSTELLTTSGWVQCDAITVHHKVAQYDVASGEISFVVPDRVVSYRYHGVMHRYKNRSTDICVTPDHDLIVQHPTSRKVTKVRSRERKLAGNYLYPSCGARAASDAVAPSVPPMDALRIAVAADGNIRANCPSGAGRSWRTVDVKLTKERKLTRFRKILAEAGVGASDRGLGSERKFTFVFPGDDDLTNLKSLDFIDLDGMSSALALAYVDEVLAWDGTVTEAVTAFYSTNRRAADKFQALCVLAGRSSVLGVNGIAGRKVTLPNGNVTTNTRTCWTVSVSDRAWRTYPARVEEVYDDEVFCVSVPHQNLVSRRNGRVAITGNTVHVAAYSHLLDTVGMPEVEYEAFLKYSQMRAKFDYMQTFNVSSKHEIARTMAAFGAFTEGLQLFASFAILLSFPRFGKMRGMGQIITWSVRDETLHCISMIKLFRTFIRENPEIWTDALRSDVELTCRTIVDHEDAFIDLAFELGDVEGLTAADVKLYIRYIADRRLTQLGLPEVYGVEANPLPWLDELLNAVEHTNFFENRATEYTKAATTGTWEDAFGDAVFRPGDRAP